MKTNGLQVIVSPKERISSFSLGSVIKISFFSHKGLPQGRFNISKRRCMFRWIQGRRFPFALLLAFKEQLNTNNVVFKECLAQAEMHFIPKSALYMLIIISHPRAFQAPFNSEIKCQGFSRTSGSTNPAVCNASCSRSNDCNRSGRKDLKITTLLYFRNYQPFARRSL